MTCRQHRLNPHLGFVRGAFPVKQPSAHLINCSPCSVHAHASYLAADTHIHTPSRAGRLLAARHTHAQLWDPPLQGPPLMECRKFAVPRDLPPWSQPQAPYTRAAARAMKSCQGCMMARSIGAHPCREAQTSQFGINPPQQLWAARFAEVLCCGCSGY